LGRKTKNENGSLVQELDSRPGNSAGGRFLKPENFMWISRRESSRIALQKRDEAWGKLILAGHQIFRITATGVEPMKHEEVPKEPVQR
jgi:hypothetical protein